MVLSGLRVAFHTDNGIVAADPDVKRTVDSAAAALSQLGAKVEESVPKALPRLMDFIYQPGAIDGHDWIRILLEKSGTERWDPHIDWFWQGATLTGEEAGRALRAWQRFRLEMLAWIRDFDVLLCPVYAKSSLPSGFEMEGDTLNGFTYTAAFNYTGWPAAVVRCGTSNNGMPIGVQVVSRAWREDICLAVAKHLETELGGWQKPSL